MAVEKSSVLDALLYSNSLFGQAVGNKGMRDYTYHSMLQTPNISSNDVEITLESGNFRQIRQSLQNSGNQIPIFSF